MSSELDRAHALYELGRLDEAEERVRAVLATEPDDVSALDVLALILMSAQRWTELAQAGAQLAAGLPESAHGYMFRSVALYNLDRREEAIGLGHEAARREPANPFVVGQLAEMLVGSDPAEAEAVILRALQLAPQQPSLHRVRSKVLVAAGRLDEAHTAATEAVGLDPMTPDNRLQLAEVLLRQHRVEEAGAEFTAVLRQDPSEENMQAVLGALGRGGVPEELDPFLDKIAVAMGMPLPSDPAEREQYLSGVRADVATSLRDSGQYEAAFDLAMSLLHKEFYDLRAYSAAMVSAWNLGRNADGLGLARDAHSHFPEAALILWFQSVFLLELDRAAEAVETATAYVEQAPTEPDGYTVLGKALHECGRLDEAEKALREALRLNPADSQAEEFLEAVRASR